MAPIKERESANFHLRWLADNNVADVDALLTETEGYLEDAHNQYLHRFSRMPFRPAGELKIPVEFGNPAGVGYTEPNGPIQFHAETWRQSPGIRKPTAAHELFHRVQYSFGFRPGLILDDDDWFFEGTAALNEVLLCGCVTRREKLTELFNSPNKSLWKCVYGALPFWMFFHRRLALRNVDSLPLLLWNYEAYGDATEALRKSLNQPLLPEDERNPIDFFVKFAVERLDWEFQNPNSVKDVDSQPILPVLFVTDLDVGAGFYKSYRRTVQAFGCIYFRFRYDSLPPHSRMTFRVSALQPLVRASLVTLSGSQVLSWESLSMDADENRFVNPGVVHVLIVMGIDGNRTVDLHVSESTG